MNLELLPNEILLDLFEYLNSIDLLRIFYGLNSRFNLLLYKQFRAYCFKFDCIFKSKFDAIYQQHLPFIANRVLTLHLFDYTYFPGQINHFLAYIPSFNHFTQLQSLTLYNLHSYETLLKLLDECCHLNNLMHLDVYASYLPNEQVDCQLIVDTIWSLSKLTKCYLRIEFEKYRFCLPTIISLSLECVTIYFAQLKTNQINQLLEYTPRLKRLSVIVGSVNKDYVPSSLPMLIDLKIHSFESFNYSKMLVFLQNVPNLRRLDINILPELIDGHQWEHIIRNYLPKLKTFQLDMCKTFSSIENIQEQADRLIDSFRSTFWINEHQWFVRCVASGTIIHLCTVSSLSYWSPSKYANSRCSIYPHDNH